MSAIRRRLFHLVIRGQNEQVNRYVGEKPSTAKPCRWCQLVETEDHVLYDEPAFVVVESPSRARGGYLTLVPKAHVRVITELPIAHLSAVLAGLSRASERMRGSGGVQVRPHPSGGRRGRGHVHFNLMPVPSPVEKLPEQPADDSSAFASLVEAISH
jgi:diadenosine tetraphosphate (Ap4A) HIT family hydrolase